MKASKHPVSFWYLAKRYAFSLLNSSKEYRRRHQDLGSSTNCPFKAQRNLPSRAYHQANLVEPPLHLVHQFRLLGFVVETFFLNRTQANASLLDPPKYRREAPVRQKKNSHIVIASGGEVGVLLSPQEVGVLFPLQQCLLLTLRNEPLRLTRATHEFTLTRTHNSHTDSKSKRTQHHTITRRNNDHFHIIFIAFQQVLPSPLARLILFFLLSFTFFPKKLRLTRFFLHPALRRDHLQLTSCWSTYQRSHSSSCRITLSSTSTPSS